MIRSRTQSLSLKRIFLRRLTFITVALVSFATILLELVQTRILSFIFWNHQVYLTLSVALLGFGISGSLTAVFSSKWQKDAPKMLSLLLLLFSASAALSLLTIYFLPLMGHSGSFLKILSCYVCNLFPYIFAGGIISIILTLPESEIGKLYAADLVSASLACVAFFFCLPLMGPDRIIGLITFSMGVLAFFWAGKTDKILRLSSFAAAAVGVFVVVFTSFLGPQFLPEDYKELYEYLTWKGSKIETTVWTPLCRIDVTTGNGFKEITQDGTAHTFLQSAESIAENWNLIAKHRDMYPGTLVFELKNKPDVAVIGVGGGIDVVNALGYGAKSVIAAEINPATYDIVTRRYADYNGHFAQDPRVKIINEEGRNMLRHEMRDFDVIQIIGIDTFAALSSGAYVLSENYLYTVESFQTFFKHLRKDGILSFARINSFPPKESIRLVSLGCEAFRRADCKTIDQQIFVVKTANDWAVCLFKNSPFTVQEFETLKQAVKARKVPVMFWPKVLPRQQQIEFENSYYKGEDAKVVESSKSFNDLIKAYENGTQTQFFDQYPSLLKPTTDDSPFFFEFAKPEFKVPNFLELRGNAAGATLCLVILESLVFSLLAIFWPLWRFKRSGMVVPSAFSFSLYFTAIGCGFLLIEVSLIQRCVLFLGNPLYSLPVVLASLLMSAGVGSWILSKTGWQVRKVIMVFGTSFLVLMTLLIFELNNLFYALMHLPLPMRMLVTFLVVFPIGLSMGTFFPSGLMAVRTKSSEFIPWAWGINGCASVFGSFAAILLAISSGFTTTLTVGLLTYLVAFLCAYNFSSENKTKSI
jgi:spermidine synthase